MLDEGGYKNNSFSTDRFEHHRCGCSPGQPSMRILEKQRGNRVDNNICQESLI